VGCPHHPGVEQGLERCTRCTQEFCPDCTVFLRGAPFCPACKYEQVKDLLSGIVPGALDLGSIGRRFGGVWIDGLITGCASYAILIPAMMAVGAAGATSSRPEAPLFIMILTYPILLGIPVVYEGLMLARRGQTVGKIALGLKVVTPDGSDLSRGQAFGRAALKLVLGSCLGIDYLPAIFTRERTCLHDLIAKTRVVRVR
jgi:uncharacterized RDD family membrane protein YckC